MGAQGPTEIVFVVEDDAEGGFVATAAWGSIIAQAGTLEELRAMMRDAVACHFEKMERPKLIRLHYVRDEVFAA